MEFDYPEIYAPLDLGIGKCRMWVAEPAATAAATTRRRWSRVRVATKYPNSRAPALRGRGVQADWCISTARWNWRRGSGCRG